MVDTPEHYTSKTCSKCYGPCGPFAALETIRRAEAKANASTPEEEKKASHLHIRSIRRCQNAECGLILHRDRNAASNIATNYRRLYRDERPLGKTDATDRKWKR